MNDKKLGNEFEEVMGEVKSVILMPIMEEIASSNDIEKGIRALALTGRLLDLFGDTLKKIDELNDKMDKILEKK